MRARKPFFLFLVAFYLSAAVCAQNVPNLDPSLDGNWRLTSDRLGQPFQVKISLGVDGAGIYGAGDYSVPCEKAGGGQFSQGASFTVRGAIEPGGSFILTKRDTGIETPGPKSIFIRGALAADGSGGWSGNFASAAFKVPGGECPAASIDFIAVRLPEFNGTFSGVLREARSDTPVGTVRLEIRQAPPSPDEPATLYRDECVVPLSARAVTEGMSGNPPETFVMPKDTPHAWGCIDGDHIDLTLAAQDGAGITFSVFPLLMPFDGGKKYSSMIGYWPKDGSGRRNLRAELTFQEQ